MTTQLLFANNAVGVLAVAASNSATTFQLNTGQGALFPAPTMGQGFYAWIQSGSTVEAVFVTNVTADVLTVTRAQEGTTAQAFPVGAIVEMRLTAAVLSAFVQASTNLFAALNGNAAQVFSAANAVAPNNVVTLSQVNALFQPVVAAGQLAQPGDIKFNAGSATPAGWLLANGAAVSRTTYAALFAAIGAIYGAGDGSTTFNLPDGRGLAIRGLDNGRGIDPGRALGSYQADDIAAHAHANYLSQTAHTHGASDGGHSHSVPGDLYQGNGYNLFQSNTGTGSGGAFVTANNYTATGYANISVDGGYANMGLTNVAYGGDETIMKNIAFNCYIKI
jgi:microcystin-dependent protein